MTPHSSVLLGGGHFSCMVWVHLSSQREGLTAGQYKAALGDHLQPMIKHFSPDGGGGLLKDDSAPVRRTGGVNEWFDEFGNDVNPMQ